jgi:hypothetical protein
VRFPGKYSDLHLGMPLHELSNHQKVPFRLTPVSVNHREMLKQSSKEIHQIAQHRRAEEMKAAKQP